MIKPPSRSRAGPSRDSTWPHRLEGTGRGGRRADPTLVPRPRGLRLPLRPSWVCGVGEALPTHISIGIDPAE